MKVSPLAAGGTPGTNIGAVSISTVSPDRIAAAKAIASGQIKPSDTPIDDRQVERIQNIRKIKMRTNVSPDRFDPLPVEAAPLAEPATINPTETTEVMPEATKPLSPQFAALARQKRAIQVKEMELAKREEALKNQVTTDGSPDLIAKLKSDPLGVLTEHGVTYDQLTQAILNGPQSPEATRIKALEAKLEALEKGVDSKLNERDEQAINQVKAEIKRETNALVSSKDEYKYVRALRNQDKVVELIDRTWRSTGEVLDTEEALKLVNEESKKDWEATNSLLTPAQIQQQQVQQLKSMKTLTNRDGARPQMSAKERAIAAFHGTLKKG